MALRNLIHVTLRIVSPEILFKHVNASQDYQHKNILICHLIK